MQENPRKIWYSRKNYKDFFGGHTVNLYLPSPVLLGNTWVTDHPPFSWERSSVCGEAQRKTVIICTEDHYGQWDMGYDERQELNGR